MKKYTLIAVLALFAFLAMPVFADVSPGYSPVAMPALIAVDVAGNATAIEGVGVQAAKSSNTKELTQYVWKAKTGTGVITNAGLVGLNRIGNNHRLPLLEVGWRAYA